VQRGSGTTIGSWQATGTPYPETSQMHGRSIASGKAGRYDRSGVQRTDFEVPNQTGFVSLITDIVTRFSDNPAHLGLAIS